MMSTLDARTVQVVSPKKRTKTATMNKAPLKAHKASVSVVHKITPGEKTKAKIEGKTLNSVVATEEEEAATSPPAPVLPRDAQVLVSTVAATTAAAAAAAAAKPSTSPSGEAQPPAAAAAAAAAAPTASCAQCGVAAMPADPEDTNIPIPMHCDFCRSTMCRKCDPAKQMCPCESSRDCCGMVRCGQCRNKATEKPWLSCNLCRRTVCSRCSDTGWQMLVKSIGSPPKGFGKKVMCMECAGEVVGGEGGGDY